MAMPIYLEIALHDDYKSACAINHSDTASLYRIYYSRSPVAFGANFDVITTNGAMNICFANDFLL